MRILLKLLFIFIPVNLSSQNYFALPDSNCIWNITCEAYRVMGDTSLNFLNYKKYYKTSDPGLSDSSFSYVGMLRQDTANKRVYGV